MSFLSFIEEIIIFNKHIRQNSRRLSVNEKLCDQNMKVTTVSMWFVMATTQGQLVVAGVHFNKNCDAVRNLVG